MEIMITPSPTFVRETKRLDKNLKIKLKKQIGKIISNPEIGKPLKYMRGERSLYIKPFRIIYAYSKTNNEIILLKFEHRDIVYK